MKAFHRFSTSTAPARTLYSYEQTGKHGKLFDVIVYGDGTVVYAINCGPSVCTKDHIDILQHFNLTEPTCNS